MLWVGLEPIQLKRRKLLDPQFFRLGLDLTCPSILSCSCPPSTLFHGAFAMETSIAVSFLQERLPDMRRPKWEYLGSEDRAVNKTIKSRLEMGSDTGQSGECRESAVRGEMTGNLEEPLALRRCRGAGRRMRRRL